MDVREQLPASAMGIDPGVGKETKEKQSANSTVDIQLMHSS